MLNKTDYNDQYEPQVELFTSVRSSTTEPHSGVSLALDTEGNSRERLTEGSSRKRLAEGSIFQGLRRPSLLFIMCVLPNYAINIFHEAHRMDPQDP